MTNEISFEAARAFQAGGRITSVRIGEPSQDITDLIRDYAFESAPPGTYAPYTPAEELRDRLNDGLQGRHSAPPVNIKYWKGPHHGWQL